MKSKDRTRRDPYRDLLIAELALVLDLATARDVAAALRRYWAERERAEADLGVELGRIAGMTVDELRRVEAEVDRLVGEAAGDSRLAVLRRGGIAPSLQSSLSEAGSGLDRELAELGVGPRLPLRPLAEGRYEEFSPIGVGGMGLVFLAFDTELGRQVALKIVHPGTSDREVASPFGLTPPAGEDPRAREFSERTSRFLLEARITSGMEHPGILPVYELGRTPEGLPYYTMRYVRGERTLADAIADAEGREDRLALLEPFLKVLDTVRYAHSRGVIHRDLKPANIALGEFGEVVVLDWGLARIREDGEDGSPGSGLERSSRRRAFGTPGYMSPEAARGETERVGERSDVYSLGATLFEILTGSRPFPIRNVVELRERLTTEDPPLATELEPWIPDELARICSRALARDPADRHSGAEELAAAIRSWRSRTETEREAELLLARAESIREGADGLVGEAFLARLDRVTATALRARELLPGDPRSAEILRECEAARERTIAGRERSALRRQLRRVAVAAVIVVAASLVVVAGMLEARRRETEDARARSEEFASLVIFGLHDDLKQVGRLDLLGRVSRTVVDHYRSLPIRGVGDRELRNRGHALFQLGDVIRMEGDGAGALDAYRRSLEIRESLFEAAPDSRERGRELVESLGRSGSTLLDLHRPDEAAVFYERARTIVEAMRAREPDALDLRSDLALIDSSVGRLLVDQGDGVGGLAMCRRALGALRVAVAGEPGNVGRRERLASVLWWTASTLSERGEWAEALRLFREDLEQRRELVALEPESIPRRAGLTSALTGLAGMLLDRGQPEPAGDLYEESLGISRWLSDWDPSNPEGRAQVARSLFWFAYSLHRAGDRDGAFARAREAIDILRPLCDIRTASVSWLDLLACNLGFTALRLEERGDRDAALETHREALGIRRRIVAAEPHHLPWRNSLADSLVRVGDLLRQRGEYSAALERLGEARRLLSRLVEEDGEQVEWLKSLARTQRLIANVHVDLDDPDLVEGDYRAAIATFERLVEKDPRNTDYLTELSTTCTALGNHLLAVRRLEPAEGELRTAVDIAERLAAAEPEAGYRQEGYAYALVTLAKLVHRQRTAVEALALFRAACAAHERAVALDGAIAPRHAAYVNRRREFEVRAEVRPPEGPQEFAELGLELHKQGRYEEGIAAFTRALDDPETRGRLFESPLRYAAGCAARHSLSAPEDEKAALRRQALDWIGEYVRRRREWLDRNDTPDNRAWLPRHFRYLRDEDPDLGALRGESGFAGIFEE